MRVGISVLFQASGGSLTNLRQMLSEWNRTGICDSHDAVFFLSQGVSRATTRRVAGDFATRRSTLCRRVTGGANPGGANPVTA